MSQQQLPIQASCHCGRFVISATTSTPYPFLQCHCSICLKVQGGAPDILASLASLTFVHGTREELSVYQAVQNRDALLAGLASEPDRSCNKRHFCGDCGSHLFAHSDEYLPELIHVPSSAVDTPLPAVPADEQVHMMTNFKAHHVAIPDAVPAEQQFTGYPRIGGFVKYHEERGWLGTFFPAKQNASSLYMTGIRDGQPRKAQALFAGETYRQHSTGVPDGKEGFIEFFDDFIQRCPERDIRILRALQDGRHVFVHAVQYINGGDSAWITTDFFNTDEHGRMIEHWDVIDAEHSPTRHDGATEITDLDRTEDNKQLVTDYVTNVLINADASAADNYVSADCTEHALSDTRPTYQELFMLVGEGNFVSTLCRARRDDKDLCHVDIYRVHDNRIVEHWDNSEPVPATLEECRNSGKF